MFVLAPLDVVDSILTDGPAETDHTAWNVANAFAVGDRVIMATTTLAKSASESWIAGERLYWSKALARVTTTRQRRNAGGFIGHAAAAAALATTTASVAPHAVYEAVAVMGAGTSPNPASDVFADTPKWVKVGSTNRHRAFNWAVQKQASASGSLSYTLAPPSFCDGLVLANVEASSAVITIKDADGVTLQQIERVTNAPTVVNYLQYFTWDPNNFDAGDFDREMIFTDLVVYPGYTVEIDLTGALVRVGEIVLGRIEALGTTMAGTETGFVDYSPRDRDSYGNADILEGEFSRTAVFRFAVMPVTDMRRVERAIADRRGKPSYWFAGADAIGFGANIYGYPEGGLRVPLAAAGIHTASLEILEMS